MKIFMENQDKTDVTFKSTTRCKMSRGAHIGPTYICGPLVGQFIFYVKSLFRHSQR
jgi:hypothetical protein